MPWLVALSTGHKESSASLPAMKKSLLIALFLLLAHSLLALHAEDPVFTGFSPNSGTPASWSSTSSEVEFSGTCDSTTTEVVLAVFETPSMQIMAVHPGRVLPPGNTWIARISLPNGNYQVQVSSDLSSPVPLPIPIDGVRSRTLTINTLTPTSITSITPGYLFNNGFFTIPGLVTISGLGEPHAELVLTATSHLTSELVTLGSTTINANGEWSVVAQQALNLGSYQLSATATLDSRVSTSQINLLVDNTPAAVNFTSLSPDTGSNNSDGITTVLPHNLIVKSSIGSRLEFSIDELESESVITESDYQYNIFPHGYDEVEQKINYNLNIMFANNRSLEQFTYRIKAFAPNGSVAEDVRVITFDRQPVPLFITALGAGDGTDPTDDQIITGTPTIAGTTELGVSLALEIIHFSGSPEPMPGMPGGMPGMPVAILPTTLIPVNTDGSWTFTVPITLAESATPYEFRLSSTRALSGKTSSLYRSVTVLPKPLFTVANDNVVNAFDLTPVWSGSLQADTTYATRELNEPLHARVTGGRSVWYRWTAPADGELEVNTFGSNFDTLLGLYFRTSKGALIRTGANDNRSTTILQSRVMRGGVVAGQVFYIAVDGKNDAHGALSLNWTLRSGRDRFADPQNLGSATSGVATFDTTHATSEVNEPDHAGVSGGRSCWFVWTAPTDGILVLETAGSVDSIGNELDTVLALYSGSTINGLKNLGAEDDDRDSLTSAIGAKVTAGTTYRIVVDVSRSAVNKNGTAHLTWLLRTATPN
jgi:hypothetical protein